MLKYQPLNSMAAACALVVGGCAAVGPDFQSPAANAPLAAHFHRHPATSEAPALSVRDVRDPAFWAQFGDKQLSELVQQSLGANLELRGAWARLQAAEAVLSQAQLDRYPTVTMSGSATQQRLGEGQLSPGQPRSSRSYQAGIAASWEIDLLGRVRRQVEAQQAQWQASQADVAALQVVVAAQVADTYAQLRGTQLRLQIVEANAQNQRETLRLVERRLQAGMGTEFDTARAQAQLQGTQARIPVLQAQAGVLQHRLAVLLGEQPGALVERLTPALGLPQMPAQPAPGAPAELLRRRPDIAAAEARLHAATASIGVATADLFPRLSLGGLLGGFALGSDDLLSGRASTRSVFLGVDWSFLDVGRVRARIAASQAGAGEALAQYQQSVLGALEETENALLRVDRSRQELASLQAAALARDKAERLAQRMYQGGTVGLYEVLDAQRDQLVAQDALAASRTDGVRSSIALYKALAGAWPAETAQEQAALD